MTDKSSYYQKIKVALVSMLLTLVMAITLASCGAETIKIKFMVDGDVYYTAQINNNRIVFPTNPTKANYDFAGWILNDELREIIFNENADLSQIKDDIQVNAKFIAQAKAPHIVMANFTKDEEVYVMYVAGDVESINFANEITTPTNEFTFVIKDANQGVIENKVADVSKGLNVFYGEFTPNGSKNITTFTFNIYVGADMPVTFNTNGGTPSIEATTVEYGLTASAPDVVITRDGYTFAGWDFDFTKPITKATEIKAKWNVVNYNITYNLNNGTNSDANPNEYTIESEDIVLANATRTGYDFVGWYKEAGFETKVTTIANGSFGDVELFAKWELIEYVITYDLQGGEMDEDETQTFTIEDETILFPEPSKEGYTFDGWYIDNVTLITVITSVRDYTLYARWTPISYSLTIGGLDNGYKMLYGEDYDVFERYNITSSTYSGVTISYGNKYPQVLDYTLLGFEYSDTSYAFSGLYTASSGGTKVFDGGCCAVANVSGYTNSSGNWICASNTTLYAQWTQLCGITVAGLQDGDKLSGFAYDDYDYTDFDMYINSTSITMYGKAGEQFLYSLYNSGSSHECNDFYYFTRSGYDYLGLFTLPTGGIKVVNTDGTFVGDIASYTKTGQYSNIWLRGDNVTLYAHWQVQTTATLTLRITGHSGGVYTSIVSDKEFMYSTNSSAGSWTYSQIQSNASNMLSSNLSLPYLSPVDVSRTLSLGRVYIFLMYGGDGETWDLGCYTNDATFVGNTNVVNDTCYAVYYIDLVGDIVINVFHDYEEA